VKVQLESTTKIVTLETERGSVPARIWEGVTESGIPVHAYITRIACDKDADAGEFEAELEAQRTPSSALQAIPLRLIL
jgi:hypothetical protein